MTALYRRAKVTVDCFVYESICLGTIYLSLNGDPETQFGAVGTVADGLPDCVTVEYLPEPVVFNDGDVVRFLDDLTDVLVRDGAVWRCNRIHIGTAPHTDAEITRALTAGLAVRLIPEATP